MSEPMQFGHLWAFLRSDWRKAAVAAALLLLVVAVTTVCTFNAVQWVGRVFPGFLLNERLAVSTVGQYQWTGSEAGLIYPEKVLAVNGRPVATMDELMGMVEAAPAGTPFTYTIKGEANTKDVTVRSMRFTATDLAMTYGITALVAMLYLGIGMAVIVLKFNARVSWVFFFACVLMSIYSVTIFDVLSTHFGFIRLYLLANAFVPAATVHLAMHFPRRWRWLESHPMSATLPYVVSAASAFPMLLLYPDERFLTFWRPLLVYWIFGAVLLLGQLLREIFQQGSGIARRRAQVVLLGAAVAFPIPAVAWLSQAVFGSVLGVRMESNYLTLPLLVFPASISYAIARHNLFDVDVYLKRAMGYAIMIATVALAYFGIQTLTVTLVLEPWFGGAAQKVYPVAFALLVVLFYNPINARVQRGVERLFFRAKADYKNTVIDVAEALARLVDPDEIKERMIETIRTQMAIDGVGLFTYDPRTADCSYVILEDRPPEQGGTRRREGTFSCDDPLFTQIARERRMITVYDVQEDPRYEPVREEFGRRFRDFGATLLMPLLLHGEATGALAVGQRKSGAFYSREDIELLGTLAGQGAVALENARLAGEMKEEEKKRSNLARYLSPQVVDRVVRGGMELNLGGGQKEVTVLFSDIRDFTSISEDHPPDVLVQVLNQYFTEMAGVVFAHSGSLDKYIGDAVVAVFGSLVEVENPARNAVEAAAEMMDRMPALNESWQRSFGFALRVGIGISTGEVFLGDVGSPERMEFTVIGDAVNTASRLSAVAEGGQILMTRATADQLGEGIPRAILAPIAVKGKEKRVEVVEVLRGERGKGASTSPGTGGPPSRPPVPDQAGGNRR